MFLREPQNRPNTLGPHPSSGPRLRQLRGGIRKVLCRRDALKLLRTFLAVHGSIPPMPAAPFGPPPRATGGGPSELELALAQPAEPFGGAVRTPGAPCLTRRRPNRLAQRARWPTGPARPPLLRPA